MEWVSSADCIQSTLCVWTWIYTFPVDARFVRWAITVASTSNCKILRSNAKSLKVSFTVVRSKHRLCAFPVYPSLQIQIALWSWTRHSALNPQNVGDAKQGFWHCSLMQALSFGQSESWIHSGFGRGATKARNFKMNWSWWIAFVNTYLVVAVCILFQVFQCNCLDTSKWLCDLLLGKSR